jgi:hypothetical protein
MHDLILAVARDALPVPPPDPEVLIHCGTAMVKLNGLPPDLQMFTMMVVEKLLPAHDYLAIVAKQYPQMLDQAQNLLALCGVG